MPKLSSDPVTVCHLGLNTVLPADASEGLLWEAVDTLDALSARLRLQNLPAIVIGCPNRQQVHSLLSWSGLSQAAASSAVVVAWPSPDRELSRRLIQTGVQDVISLEDAQGARLKRTVLQAVDRKAQDLEVRRAWSIDLGTGLPNRALLIELLNQLCALREREPAPMALLVFRLDGLEAIEARLGGHAAQLLKRKAAVRLRAGLRSSDVVAVVGSDAFAAVLPSMERPQDGERVAAKLAQSIAEPYVVTGQQAVLGIGTGVSLFPDHGRQAEELLRLAYAAAVQTHGQRRSGMIGGMGEAANDE